MRPEKMRRGIKREINKLRGVQGRNVCEGGHGWRREATVSLSWSVK